MNIVNLRIADIRVPEGRRKLRRVDELAESIHNVGLVHPITVTPGKVLVSGYHRLEACKKLEWGTIPAIERDESVLKWQLIEIDENLIRNEYQVLERGNELSRRKEIYLALYPETKAGVAGAEAKHGRASEQSSFAEDTAEKTDVSKRTVEQYVQIAEKITPEVKAVIEDIDIADSKTDLLALARMEPEKQAVVAERLAEGATSVKNVDRELQREDTAELAKEVESVTGKYRCIVIDPPWEGKDSGDKDPIGKGDPNYVTMSFDDIAKLPVADLVEPDDCHLYMWVTNRMLPKAFALLDGWGVRYITTLTWCKPSIGVGRYYRNNTEHVIFGIVGSRLLAKADVGTWFEAKREGPHSTKPQEFYDIVESCSPGPRLEMFGRKQREGWTVWGAEADG